MDDAMYYRQEKIECGAKVTIIINQEALQKLKIGHSDAKQLQYLSKSDSISDRIYGLWKLAVAFESQMETSIKIDEPPKPPEDDNGQK